MTEPLQTFEQDPGETLDYSVDFASHCSRLREPDTDYTLNTRVRPARANGYQYKASAGRTGTAEPRWPTTVGATVQDGSVTWTCEAIDTQSLRRTVSAVSWAVDTGLTKGTESLSGTKGTVLLSGGTLGQRYLVRATATCSDTSAPVVAFFVEVRRPARVVEA
jgi:hypothetical protein